MGTVKNFIKHVTLGAAVCFSGMNAVRHVRHWKDTNVVAETKRLREIAAAHTSRRNEVIRATHEVDVAANKVAQDNRKLVWTYMGLPVNSNAPYLATGNDFAIQAVVNSLGNVPNLHVGVLGKEHVVTTGAAGSFLAEQFTNPTMNLNELTSNLNNADCNASIRYDAAKNSSSGTVDIPGVGKMRLELRGHPAGYMTFAMMPPGQVGHKIKTALDTLNIIAGQYHAVKTYLASTSK